MSPPGHVTFRDVPAQMVTVQDPSGRHRIFHRALAAEMTGVNLLAGVPVTAYVRPVALGVPPYVVPYGWIRPLAGAAAPVIGSAIVIPFPDRGHVGRELARLHAAHPSEAPP